MIHSIDTLIAATKRCFQQLTKKYLFFQLAFFFILAVEVVLLGFFFSLLIDTFFFGLALALIFFTALLYFILRLYVNEQKPEEFSLLITEFFAALPHLTVEERQKAPQKLLWALEKEKLCLYRLPHFLQSVQPSFDIAAIKLHSNDIFLVKEALFIRAIESIFEAIAKKPLSVSLHHSLVELYETLSKLYEQEALVSRFSLRTQLEKKRVLLLEKALEELAVLSSLVPHDLMVLKKMAHGYRALKKEAEAIAMYEKLLTLEPHDTETLYILGKSYFYQGKQKKGLEAYEQIQSVDPDRAKELLFHYGTHVRDLCASSPAS